LASFFDPVDFLVYPAAGIRYLARVQFRKISIIGVGLLGGSLGLAVRKHKLAGEVAGYVRREASQRECERVGAVDYATTDLLAAVSNSNLVVLCTPLAQMPALAAQILPALKRGAIVTDVGSVKAEVVRELEVVFKNSGAHFVGAHPMAGGEKMGVLASRVDLYDNALCIITPSQKSNPGAVKKLTQFWRALGSRTVAMDAAEHDLLVSRSSHLPHVLAATLASFVLDPKQPKLQAELCASGFRGTTRLASGSPEMWRDISLSNRKNIDRAVDGFIGELKKFQTMLRTEQPAGLEKFFATAKQRRDDWCSSPASNASE
jgi:prephenate dehydrogenase